MPTLKEMLAAKKAAARSNTDEVRQDASQIDSGASQTAQSSSSVGTEDSRISTESQTETNVPEIPAQRNDSETKESGTEDAEKSNGISAGDIGRVEPTSATESPEVIKLRLDLADLRDQLDQKIPGFATLLRDIHIKLRQDPAIVTVLSPDERKTIISGLSRHADIEVVAPKAVKSAKAAVRGRTIQADDL